MRTVLATVLLLSAVAIFQVGCHVALMDPPARNVLWRSGYPELPKHQDDDYLLCQEEQGARCPPCGDSANSKKPLAHQAGGQWALGIIGRNYTVGESIQVAVSVTNSHGGHMEFKLCANNDVKKMVTQRCLDQHPLEVKGHTDGKVPVTAPYQGKQEIEVQVKLPRDMSCDQCVLQMSQYAEQFKPSNVMFRNCADIAIRDPRSSSSRSSSSNTGHRKSSSSSGFGSSRRQSSNRQQSSSRSHGSDRRPSSSSSRRQQQSAPAYNPRQSVFADHQSSVRGGPSPFAHFASPEQTPSFTHSQTQFSKQPSSAAGFGRPSHVGGSSSSFGHFGSQQGFPSHQAESQRFFTQPSQQAQQFVHPGFNFDQSSSKFQKPHVRNERRPTPVLFNSSPSVQSLSSQKFATSHPVSGGFHTPNFSGSNSATKYSNSAKFSSGSQSSKPSRSSSSNFGNNKGFSGFSSSDSESGFHARSKSMFPVHQPQVYTGFGGPSHIF